MADWRNLMTILDVFSLLVLTVIVLTVLAVIVFLAILPGKVAVTRNHPQADAVRVAGWVGILAGGILWPFAIVWAYYQTADSADKLRARVRELEAELAKTKGGPA